MTTRVTAVDTETGDTQTVEITNNYVLVREGTCRLMHTQLCGDGTHILTVRGIRGIHDPGIERPRTPRGEPVPPDARDIAADALMVHAPHWDANTEPHGEHHPHEGCFSAWWPTRTAVSAAVIRGLIEAGWTLTQPGGAS